MKIVKVTTNGRVTIPYSLRKKYGLYPGRKAKLETTNNCIKMIPLITPEEVKENSGFMKTKGKLLKALMGEKKREMIL